MENLTKKEIDNAVSFFIQRSVGLLDDCIIDGLEEDRDHLNNWYPSDWSIEKVKEEILKYIRTIEIGDWL